MHGAVVANRGWTFAHAHTLSLTAFGFLFIHYQFTAVSKTVDLRERQWAMKGSWFLSSGPWFTSYVLSGCYLHDRSVTYGVRIFCSLALQFFAFFLEFFFAKERIIIIFLMDSRYKPSGINFFNSAVTCQKFFNKPLTLQRTGHQWRFEKENNGWSTVKIRKKIRPENDQP